MFRSPFFRFSPGDRVGYLEHNWRHSFGVARLAASRYAYNETANLPTCDHREAVANLLNGLPAFTSFGERMKKTKISTRFVHSVYRRIGNHSQHLPRYKKLSRTFCR
jgi:hypothetical protein